MAPGVRYSGAIDVGGNRTGQFASGGSNFGSNQQSPFLEGINTRLFEGGSMAYLDQRALDEIQVTAVGSSSEFATPGVSWTGVVKSGGNEFHGLASYYWSTTRRSRATTSIRPWRTRGSTRQATASRATTISPANSAERSFRTNSGFSPPTAASSASRDQLGFVGGKGANGKYDAPTDPLNDDPLATRTMWNPGYTLKLSYQPATDHRLIGFVSRSIKNERQRGASVFVPEESTFNYWYDPTPWKLGSSGRRRTA